MAGFIVNTNRYGIYANARTNSTNERITSSLEKLSSGLKINKAADDASGLAIANSLRSQSTGLSQAIKNANEAIGIVQIADNAMEEMSSILNTIKAKSIQSAQDGQSAESRLALQKDVQRYLEELNNIAETTSYNGQVLLSGAFVNRSFQIGAYSNETASINIEATDTKSIGHVRQEVYDVTHLNGDDDMQLGEDISLNLNGMQLQSVTMGTESGQGVGELSRVINAYSDQLKTRATYEVELISSGPVKEGDLEDIEINGVNLGTLTDVLPNDSDGKLVSLINSVKDTTGVSAYTDESGALHLVSEDGRAIETKNLYDLVPMEYTGQEDYSPPVAGDSLTINGVDIEVQGGESLDDIIDLINAKSKDTGVTASKTAVPPSTEETKLVINGTITEFTVGNESGEFETGLSNRGNEYTEFGTLQLTRIGSEDIKTEFGITNLEGVEGTYTAPAEAGTIILNGVEINYNGGETVEELSDLINAVSAETGVIASPNETGDLSFTGNVKELIGVEDINQIKIELGNEKAISEDLYNLDMVVTDDLLLSRDGAMRAMDIIDAAIKDIDKIRSDIGSTQNKLTSTINNITITQANVQIAESGIRDVDFAEETANFNKDKLLAQAGTYALSQANEVAQNVLKLLQ